MSAIIETQKLVLRYKEIGLEVNAEKAKYVFMSRDQNVGRNHNLMTDNKYFVNVAEFMRVGTIITHQNVVTNKLKKQVKFGECLLALSSEFFFYLSIFSLKISTETYKTIILSVVLYWCEIWFLTLRDGTENKVMRRSTIRRITKYY